MFHNQNNAAGEVAGKMTTRGVGEAPGPAEPSAVVEAGSVDRFAFE
jgi:hypothetical protein